MAPLETAACIAALTCRRCSAEAPPDPPPPPRAAAPSPEATGTENPSGREKAPSRGSPPPPPPPPVPGERVTRCSVCPPATPRDASVAEASGPSSRPRKMRRCVSTGSPVGPTRSCLSSPTVAWAWIESGGREGGREPKRLREKKEGQRREVRERASASDRLFLLAPFSFFLLFSFFFFALLLLLLLLHAVRSDEEECAQSCARFEGEKSEEKHREGEDEARSKESPEIDWKLSLEKKRIAYRRAYGDDVRRRRERADRERDGVSSVAGCCGGTARGWRRGHCFFGEAKKNETTTEGKRSKF